MENLKFYTIMLFSFFVIFWIDENYIHAFRYSHFIVSFFIEHSELIFKIWGIIVIIFWGFEIKKKLQIISNIKRRKNEKDSASNMERSRSGVIISQESMSAFKNLEQIKDQPHYFFRKENEYYNLPMDKLDKIFIDNGEIEEYEIRNYQFYLKRKLSRKELLIIKLCSKNGIYINVETDFK